MPVFKGTRFPTVEGFNMTIAFYPGSFDPMTLGHLDILEKALMLFGEVVVGIGSHSSKKPMFSFEERATLINLCVQEKKGAVEDGRMRVVSFEGLAVDAATTLGAGVIVRGLRDGTDLDYEMRMAGMNGVMQPDVVTVFLPASPLMRPITATLVRQIARLGGNVASFVPAPVASAILNKID